MAQDVAQTLVQNFEQLRQVALTVPGYTRQIDDKVMTAIQVAQQIAGVKDQINALVDEHTEHHAAGIKRMNGLMDGWMTVVSHIQQSINPQIHTARFNFLRTITAWTGTEQST